MTSVLTQQQVLWICRNFGFDTWDHHRWQTPSQNKDDPEKLMLDPLYLIIYWTNKFSIVSLESLGFEPGFPFTVSLSTQVW